MGLREQIRVNNFDDCYLEEFEEERNYVSLVEERHYYLKNKNEKILAEYEVYYYRSSKCVQIAYRRLDNSLNSKGCVSYGLKKIIKLLFDEDEKNLLGKNYIIKGAFLEISPNNFKSVKVAKECGFTQKAENIFAQENPKYKRSGDYEMSVLEVID